MSSHQLQVASFRSGHHPTAPPSGPDRVRDSIRDGRNVWILPGGSPQQSGLVRSANLIGPITGLLGGVQIYLVGSQIGVMAGFGSICKFLGGSEFFVGGGKVYLNNVEIATAQTTLQFRLTSQGAKVFKAGLPALTQKIAGIVGTGANTGRSKGTVSVKLARFSTLTAAESNGFLVSEVLLLNNEKITIPFPPTKPDSTQDAWRVYFTPLGFGSENTHLFFTDEVVGLDSPGITKSYDFLNSELGSERPKTDHNVPLDALFVAALQNIVLLFGTGEGNVGISPSIPGDPESYPPGAFLVTTPADVPIGFAARASQDQLIFWTRTSLQAAVYTNDPDFPIQIQTLWPTTGLQGAHAGAFGEDEFQCFSGTAGCPIRIIDGRADTDFANQVAEAFRREAWPGTTVVGYDRRFDCFVYCHPILGIARPWMRKIQQWGPPIEIPTGAGACVTDAEGRLFISFGNDLLQWEGGEGGDFYVRTEDGDEDLPGTAKTYTGFMSAVNIPIGKTITEELYLNGELTTPAVTQVTNGTGKLQLTEWVPTSELATQRAFKLKGNGAGHEVYFINYSALYEQARR